MIELRCPETRVTFHPRQRSIFPDKGYSIDPVGGTFIYSNAFQFMLKKSETKYSHSIGHLLEIIEYGSLLTMNEPSDSILVQRSLSGDKTAFTRLVVKYQTSVFGLAYRMTGNRDDAADVAQDTFIRAYSKLNQYKHEFPLKNWLLSICANQTKNRMRKIVRRRGAEQGHFEMYTPDMGDVNPRRIALEEVLASIPESLRIPLVLKHIEGFSYEEISEILNIGISAAKMRVKRGRDLLIDLLDTNRGETT